MAETEVEKLVVGVGFRVDTGQLAKVMATSRQQLGSLVTLGKKVGGAVTDALGTVGLVVAGAGASFAAFAASQAASEAALLRTAQAARVSVEDLSALQHATARSGLGAEAATQALGGLSDALRGAQQLGSGAALAMGTLGLRTRNADGSLRSAADVLPEVADKLLRVKNEARRAELGTQLLGGAYSQIRPLLAQGSAGIERLTARARILGAVTSEKAAKASAEFAASLTDLRGVVGGLSSRFSAIFIPGLTKVADRLVQVLTASDGIVNVGLDKFARAFGFALSGLQTPAGQAAAAIGTLAAFLGIGKAAGGVMGLLGTLGPVGTAIKTLGMGLGGLVAGPLGIAAILVGGFALILEDLYVAATGGESAILNLAKSFGVGDDFQKQLSNGLTTMNNLFIIGKTVAGEMAAQIGEGFEKAGKLFADSVGWLEKMVPAIKPVTEAIKGLAAGFKDLVSAIPGQLMGLMTGASQQAADYTSGLASGTLGERDKNKTAAVFGPLGGLLESAAQRKATGQGKDWMDIQKETEFRQSQFRGENRAAASTAGGQAINVTVNAGMAAWDVANQAANAVRQQVYAQAAGTEALR